MRKRSGHSRALATGLVCLLLILSTTVVLATTSRSYTTSNGKLQDNHVNDVFIYEPYGESSSNALGFDANWVHGVAKTTGDPTVNPSSNISLSGTQSDKTNRLRVRIETGGATGTATFKTSLDGGSNWSSDTYTTQSTAQNLMVDATDTGLDITFAADASWTAGDVFTIASWWGEGSGSNRSSAQDFPQRAAIIVTDGGVEIIDLSNDSVWMRFVPSNTDQAADQNLVAGPVHTVTALNGKIYLGGEGGYMGGVAVIDMMADKAWFYDDGNGWDWTSNIARRNDGSEADAGWAQANPAYPSLTSATVHDLDAAAVGGHTYVAIGTSDKFDLLKDYTDVYYNTHSRCLGNVTAVALIGNDLYWSGEETSYPYRRALCVHYDVSGIPSTGSWPTMYVYDTGYPTNANLISTNINALDGRNGGSPEESNSNIVYVATDSGLTILHEDQTDQASGVSYHYGHTGSTNADLDYKVLAGDTDQVSDVTFAPGYTAVYVATNDGSGGGAVSVLRPYIHSGDTPHLKEYYRTSTTPSILSNDVSSLAHGSDLLVGTDSSGANLLADAPNAVTLKSFGASSPGNRIVLAVVAALVLGALGALAYRRFFHSNPRRYRPWKI